jgi:HTH-type transcriptional regulator/antitoxin HipB
MSQTSGTFERLGHFIPDCWDFCCYDAIPPRILGKTEEPAVRSTPKPESRIRSTQDVGLWIRHARRAQGLSVVEAADLCGVSKNTLSAVENGRATARVGTVLVIARALGVRIAADFRGRA